jgi:hypothetical protein
MVRRHKDERISRSVSMLISMAVRYPEISSVKYEPRQQTVRLSLLITGELAAEEWAKTESALLDMLDVYLLLGQRQPSVMEVERESYGDLTAIAITRDAATFTPEEIYTMVEFFRERFAGRMVSELVDFGAEDEWTAQDEMIEDLLADLESSRNARNLIAIREDGRVVVFQK